jgi:hypothetical protein
MIFSTEFNARDGRKAEEVKKEPKFSTPAKKEREQGTAASSSVAEEVPVKRCSAQRAAPSSQAQMHCQPPRPSKKG